MQFSENGLNAMRLGPGKHIKGLTLMGGIVTPEEVRDASTTHLNLS